MGPNTGQKTTTKNKTKNPQNNQLQMSPLNIVPHLQSGKNKITPTRTLERNRDVLKYMSHSQTCLRERSLEPTNQRNLTRRLDPSALPISRQWQNLTNSTPSSKNGVLPNTHIPRLATGQRSDSAGDSRKEDAGSTRIQ